MAISKQTTLKEGMRAERERERERETERDWEKEERAREREAERKRAAVSWTLFLPPHFFFLDHPNSLMCEFIVVTVSDSPVLLHKLRSKSPSVALKQCCDYFSGWYHGALKSTQYAVNTWRCTKGGLLRNEESMWSSKGSFSLASGLQPPYVLTDANANEWKMGK